MQTGLHLIELPTIVWHETDYSIYVMRQASRRSRCIRHRGAVAAQSARVISPSPLTDLIDELIELRLQLR